MTDAIGLKTAVEIQHGDSIQIGENKILFRGRLSLISSIAAGSIQVSGTNNGGWSNLPGASYSLRLGTDVSSPTDLNQASLIAELGWLIGLTQQKATFSNASERGCTFIFTAPPNALTDGVTIGEFGLYMSNWTATGFRHTVPNNFNPAQSLFSRIAAGDGELTPFVYNAALPLTVAWTVKFSF